MLNEGEGEQSVITYENAGRLVISTIAYPIENAKTLIQMGHEPIKPFPAKTLFGKPTLGLPTVFSYVKHIYKVDGLQGCYRGFIPWISTTLLYRYSQNKAKETFPKVINEDKSEDDLSEDERLTLFASLLYRGVVCRTVAIIVSQPLHVITIRTIAQFVGHETKYSGVISGLWAIIKEEGVFGLFSGLLPRLLCDVCIYTVATTGIYLLHEYCTRDQEARRLADTVMQYIASSTFYSLNVVNQCIPQTRSHGTSSSPTKTSPTDEARRSFLSSLSQGTEEKSRDRTSVASNSTAGDTVYSLSDIEEVLTDEEKEIKEAFAHENRQDELELFVQQDAGRTERLRKRYSSTPKLDNHIPSAFVNCRPSQKTISSTNLTNFTNENNLKKERPKFGSTIEILQQLQQQIETPYQLEGRRTACSNYSDSSIPISERLFCDESSDGYEPVLPKMNVHRTCSLDYKNYEEIDNFPSAFSVPRTKSHEHPRLSQTESDPYFYPSLSTRYPGNFTGRNQLMEQNVYASSPDLHGYHHPVFPDRVSSYNSHLSRPKQLHPVLQRQYCRYPVNEVSRPEDEGKILTPPIRMHTYMNVPVNSPAYPAPPPYSKVPPYTAPPHHDFYPYESPPVHSNIYQNIPIPTSPNMMTISRLCMERERGVPEGASSSHDSDEVFSPHDFYYNSNMTTIPKPSSLPYHYCVDV